MALPKVIYVMGPPGAGKGTQAEMLAQAIDYHRFSTGDAFRAMTRTDTDLGRKVKGLIDNGLLCPPELAAEVVISAITKFVDQEKGLVFDGTPRTVREAEIVDQFFVDHDYGRPLALYLVVGKEDMIERNSKRQFCLDIDGDFPVVTDEDVKRCEALGGRVGARPDDDPEKFVTRWNEFQENTAPVIAKYKEEGILEEIDGKQSVPKVFEEMMAVIEKRRA